MMGRLRRRPPFGCRLSVLLTTPKSSLKGNGRCDPHLAPTLFFLP